MLRTTKLEISSAEAVAFSTIYQIIVIELADVCPFCVFSVLIRFLVRNYFCRSLNCARRLSWLMSKAHHYSMRMLGSQTVSIQCTCRCRIIHQVANTLEMESSFFDVDFKNKYFDWDQNKMADLVQRLWRHWTMKLIQIRYNRLRHFLCVCESEYDEIHLNEPNSCWLFMCLSKKLMWIGL